MENTIRKELERLRLTNGGLLLPEKIVEASREETSPLHASFGWGKDEQLANERRLDIARGLIRVFERVIVWREPDPPRIFETKTKVYGSHPILKHGYALTADLLAGPECKTFLLQEFKRCMGHVERLAAFLHEAGLHDTAEHLKQSLLKAQTVVLSMAEADTGS